MNRNFLQILICIFSIVITLYICIERQNELTELQLLIPALEKELHLIQEQNTRLAYEINQFESPIHLMDLAKKPEFSHLKFPYDNEIIILTSEELP